VLPRGALVDAIARSIRSSDESSVSRENTSSAAVTFEYGKSLRFVDLDNRVAFFDDVSTQCSTNDVFVEVTYDVLVGADGAESVVRGTLEREGVLKCERNADGLFAKTVALPPGFYTHEIDWHRRRHSWPSGLVDAFATPNADGSFDLTIVAPIGFWERVRDASDAEALLESFMPNAFERVDDTTYDSYKSNAIEVLLNPNALHPNGVSTFCSRLTAFDGSAVLVGDAAHAAWPTLGQNMDATLETSAYLGAALERAMDTHASGGVLGGKEDDGGNENNFDVKTALTNYFERGRAPAARAYVRLCETGFGSGDVGFKRRVENFFFFAKLFVVTCLHRLLPFLFDAPALSKMDDPSWGYDDVEDETRRESGTVFGVLFSLITLVVATRRFGFIKVVESLVTTGRALLTGDANGGEGVVIVVLGFVALVTAAFRFAEKRRARKRETRRGNATRRETRVA
jgi:kynurenine 3-monooxygenase